MKPTILLIEDNADMAENICGILELAHYQVLTAPNGKVGVDLAQQKKPDLILCDIMMPELDGYGVLHILNNDPDTSAIPFIFLTAKADKLDFRSGMNLGADDYITKPFEGVDLLKVIEMRLKKSELLRVSYGGKEASTFFNEARESKDFEKLLSDRPLRMIKKKELLFMEGQTPNDLYYIATGKIKTYKINYDGKELITKIYHTGEFLGYVPLLEDKPYNENAEILEDSKLVIIPKLDFLTLIYGSKDMTRKFIRMISSNLDELEDRLMEIAYQSVRQRVAGALLKVSPGINPSGKEELITVARKDIANLVGTATESLNRTLADFKDEGLIDVKGEGLRIINRAKLERLIQNG